MTKGDSVKRGEVERLTDNFEYCEYFEYVLS